MKKILLISYYYPPLNDVGSLRALGFSKYLPMYGWKPFVLSVKNPDKNFCLIGKEKRPQGVEVFYSRSLLNLMGIMGKLNGIATRLFRVFGVCLKRNMFTDLFCIPDIFIGWIPLTILKGFKLIKKNNIDVIYVSCKPFSSALIGASLRKLTGKPLIVDLRDPIIVSFNDDRSITYNFNKRANKAIEKRVLKKVDKLIFVTKTTEQQYLSKYSFLEGKTAQIYNGFFSDLLPKGKIKPFDKFTIVYVGNFYINYSDSELIFEALQKLIQEERVPKTDIRFCYMGQNIEWFRENREAYRLNGIVDCKGLVLRQKSIEALCKASVIYLRIVKDMISTKLYEGLSTGNPILAPISNEEVINIIKKYSPHSVVTKSNDSDLLATAIENLYRKWQEGSLIRNRNPEYIKDFDKQNLTAEFANIANSII